MIKIRLPKFHGSSCTLGFAFWIWSNLEYCALLWWLGFVCLVILGSTRVLWTERRQGRIGSYWRHWSNGECMISLLSWSQGYHNTHPTPAHRRQDGIQSYVVQNRFRIELYESLFLFGRAAESGTAKGVLSVVVVVNLEDPTPLRTKTVYLPFTSGVAVWKVHRIGIPHAASSLVCVFQSHLVKRFYFSICALFCTNGFLS